MTNITELAQKIENSEARFEERAKLRLTDEQKNAVDASEAVKELSKKLGDSGVAQEFGEQFGEILAGGYSKFVRERNIFDKIRDYSLNASKGDNDAAAIMHTQSIANQYASGRISVQDIMGEAGTAIAEAEKSAGYASFLSSIIIAEVQSVDGARKEIEADIRGALKKFKPEGATNEQKVELAAKVIGAMPIVFQSLESKISALSMKNNTVSAELETTKKSISDFNSLSLFSKFVRILFGKPL